MGCVTILPEKEFDWVTDIQLNEFDVCNIADDSPIGYILEVDLRYPNHLHDLHSDYPLAPETFTTQPDMLSPHSQKLKEDLNITGKPSPK